MKMVETTKWVEGLIPVCCRVLAARIKEETAGDKAIDPLLPSFAQNDKCFVHYSRILMVDFFLPLAPRCCVDIRKFPHAFIHGDICERFSHDPVMDGP